MGVATLAAVGAVGSAAALAATKGRVRSSRTSLHFFGGKPGAKAKAKASFDPTQELGIQAPARFWDPMGLSANKDEATFKRRRATELKHGRVSMIACIGYIVPEYFRWPGYLSPSQDLKFTDVPNGLAALSKVPLLGWAQIVIFAGMCEASGLNNGRRASIGWNKDASMAGEPGNYGLGFLGCGLFGTIKDKATRDRKLNAEIANGRLAMFAIMSMLFQNGTVGNTGPEMWGDIYFEPLVLQILIPTILLLTVAGETFRRGPDGGKPGPFMAQVDRPDVYKYKGRV